MSKIQIFVIDDSDEEDTEKPRYSTIIEEEPYEDEDEPQPICSTREYKTIQDEDIRKIPEVKGWDPHEPNFFQIQ